MFYSFFFGGESCLYFYTHIHTNTHTHTHTHTDTFVVLYEKKCLKKNIFINDHKYRKPTNLPRDVVGAAVVVVTLDRLLKLTGGSLLVPFEQNLNVITI